MFTKEQKRRALTLYHVCGSIGETVRKLGYPSRRMLYHWIKNDGKERPGKRTYRNINTPEHPRNPSTEVKIQAIHRCFECGESIKSVAEEIGYTRASIYAWRRRYARGGFAALMNEKNIVPGPVCDSNIGSKTSPTTEELQAKIKEMQLEIDMGVRTKSWTAHTAKPRLCLYSIGLILLRDILILLSLYHKRYSLRIVLNSWTDTLAHSRQ